MITRIVKLSFSKEDVQSFYEEFNAVKHKVIAFPGCIEMKLLEHPDSGVFFTVSRWENEDALEAYRISSTFTSLWAKIKPLFSARAEAWTLTSVYEGAQENS